MGRFHALSSMPLFVGLLAGCSPTQPVEELTAVVHERLPFDATSFTQGLEVAPDGNLVVGTGWVGESRIYTLSLIHI